MHAKRGGSRPFRKFSVCLLYSFTKRRISLQCTSIGTWKKELFRWMGFICVAEKVFSNVFQYIHLFKQEVKHIINWSSIEVLNQHTVLIKYYYILIVSVYMIHIAYFRGKKDPYWAKYVSHQCILIISGVTKMGNHMCIVRT